MEELKMLFEVERYVGKGEWKKLRGAKIVTIIKEYLRSKGFNISERDVFIEGLPNEIDLLLLKDYRHIKNDALQYKPSDVKAIFEIKSTSIYGKEYNNFIKKIKAINNKIKCIYIALAVNKNSTKELTPQNSQKFDKVFTLFYHNQSKDRKQLLNQKKISIEEFNKLKNYYKTPNQDISNLNGLLDYLKNLK